MKVRLSQVEEDGETSVAVAVAVAVA